jgi:hypothetical protein
MSGMFAMNDWERAWPVTEFTFNPESLTGLIKRKTHAIKVTIESYAGTNHVEIFFDSMTNHQPPTQSLYLPANVVAVYKEQRARR